MFDHVRRRGVPILMVTSGGYQVHRLFTSVLIIFMTCIISALTLPLMQRNNAEVIADSILNLREKQLIFSPEDDVHISSELKEQTKVAQQIPE